VSFFIEVFMSLELDGTWTEELLEKFEHPSLKRPGRVMSHVHQSRAKFVA